MRTRRTWLWLPLLTLLAAPLAWAGAEGTTAPATEQGTETPATEQDAAIRESLEKERVDLGSPDDREAWVRRIRAAYEGVEDAKLREDEAAIGYGKARHKRKTRGEAKRKVLEERQESRGAVAEAEAELERVLAEARKAGVPPGWIREAQARTGPASID